MPENMLGRRCCTHTHTSTLGKQVETERGRRAGRWVRGLGDVWRTRRRTFVGIKKVFCESDGSSGVDTAGTHYPRTVPGRKKEVRLTRPFRRMWQLVPADTPRSSADCSRHPTYARPWRLLSAAANCLVTLGAVFFFVCWRRKPPEPGARVACVRGWDDVRVCCSDTHKAGPDGISAVINARTHARTPGGLRTDTRREGNGDGEHRPKHGPGSAHVAIELYLPFPPRSGGGVGRSSKKEKCRGVRISSLPYRLPAAGTKKYPPLPYLAF